MCTFSAGSDGFKFGYQLNRESNDIFQGYNVPSSRCFSALHRSTPASAVPVEPIAPPLLQKWGPQYADPQGGDDCTGTYGYAIAYDFGSSGKATSYNHSFFVQDSWTIARGVAVNYGLHSFRKAG
jgi:hypothetical protein